MGKNLEVAIAIGVHPLVIMAAATPLPIDLSEWLFAGIYGGSGIPLAKCKTLDLEVPADAEFVLEGTITPGETSIDGPAGDHMGYYGGVNEKAPLILRNLYETYQSITVENYQEAYHDATQFKEEAISVFGFGYLSLTDRALAERLYWACCAKILTIVRQQDYVPDDLEDLEKIMASIYYVNFSVFQSSPDSWAIDQLFPIMPIHRLDEEPTRRATLADLTCDSDGKIDQFIDLRDVKYVLELHALKPAAQQEENLSPHPETTHEPYYLGMFLNGAYQEVMGNLHNLFGDTNAVHIKLTPKGYQIEHVVKGDTMTEVLGYVQYDSEDLIEKIRRRTELALQENQITLEEARLLLQNYEHSLSRYTYLSS
jgi:arginine decarboxylase